MENRRFGKLCSAVDIAEMSLRREVGTRKNDGETADARVMANLQNLGMLSRVDENAQSRQSARSRTVESYQEITNQQKLGNPLFARHRLEKDVNDLMLSRNQFFLPHAQVQFHSHEVPEIKSSNVLQVRQRAVRENNSVIKSNLRSIVCGIEPFDGVFRGVVWKFLLEIPESYPFEAPRITALSPVFHPNVEPKTGTVALPLLNQDWSPVLTLRIVVLGLVLLFVEPNLDNIANAEAGELVISNQPLFFQKVEFYRRRILEENAAFSKLGSPLQHRENGMRPKRQSENMEECESASKKRCLGNSTRPGSPFNEYDENHSFSDENFHLAGNLREEARPRWEVEKGAQGLGSQNNVDYTQGMLVQKLTHCSLSQCSKRRKLH